MTDERRGEAITLIDESGSDVEYEYLDSVQLEDKEYIVLLPIEQPVNGEGEVAVVQVTRDNEGKEEYLLVNGDEFNRVFESYKKKMMEEISSTEEE